PLSNWNLRDCRAVSPDGTVMAGTGSLDGVTQGWVISGLPRIAAPCYANCDGSTGTPVLNVADFTCFLQKYASGAAAANCDGSTASPVLNVADFACFLQRYSAGCP